MVTSFLSTITILV